MHLWLFTIAWWQPAALASVSRRVHPCKRAVAPAGVWGSGVPAVGVQTGTLVPSGWRCPQGPVPTRPLKRTAHRPRGAAADAQQLAEAQTATPAPSLRPERRYQDPSLSSYKVHSYEEQD